MIAFKIYKEDRMGFEYEVSYACKYNMAIQMFNNAIRKEYREAGGDIVDRSDFSEEIIGFREYNKDSELICRTYPIIIHKKDKKLIAHIPQWENTSYEYNEYEILGDSIILEEIELLD